MGLEIKLLFDVGVVDVEDLYSQNTHAQKPIF